MIRRLPYLLLLSLMVFACDSETVRRDDFAVHGIDVSHYQSYINWDVVVAQNVHFAFVKASEGATLKDSLYCLNWDDMQRVGLKRGAYHFFRPRVPADIQLDNFINQVNLEYGDLPPVLDVEVLDGVSNAQLIVGIKTWLYLAELHYGVKPILYTGLKFYNKHLAGHFEEYPLWVARYNDREPTLACGRDWQFWQYGNRGHLDGIDGHVDFNVFAGGIQALEQLCIQPHNILSGQGILQLAELEQ